MATVPASTTAPETIWNVNEYVVTPGATTVGLALTTAMFGPSQPANARVDYYEIYQHPSNAADVKWCYTPSVTPLLSQQWYSNAFGSAALDRGFDLTKILVTCANVGDKLIIRTFTK